MRCSDAHRAAGALGRKVSTNAYEGGIATDGVVVTRTFDITPKEAEMPDESQKVCRHGKPVGHDCGMCDLGGAVLYMTPEMWDAEPNVTISYESVGQFLVLEPLVFYQNNPEALGRALLDMLEECDFLADEREAEDQVVVGLKRYTKKEVEALPEHPGW